jgi:hypothetical protein
MSDESDWIDGRFEDVSHRIDAIEKIVCKLLVGKQIDFRQRFDETRSGLAVQALWNDGEKVRIREHSSLDSVKLFDVKLSDIEDVG